MTVTSLVALAWQHMQFTEMAEGSSGLFMVEEPHTPLHPVF